VNLGYKKIGNPHQSFCGASVITLTLLHPVQLTKVQHWTFETEPIVRIGRSTDNHVVLYSAVVSRYHVEMQHIDSVWHVVSLGANGTYLDGKRISHVPAQDGMIIRLARSGPNVQIHLEPSLRSNKDLPTLPREVPAGKGDPSALGSSRAAPFSNLSCPIPELKTAMEVDSQIGKSPCTHQERTSDLRFCSHCGAPLKM
jgi:hypothetical protein